MEWNGLINPHGTNDGEIPTGNRRMELDGDALREYTDRDLSYSNIYISITFV